MKYQIFVVVRTNVEQIVEKYISVSHSFVCCWRVFRVNDF